MGVGTTLLVDTYNIEQGIETAIRVAGAELGGIRLDSGDLPKLVGKVRAQLDALGAKNTKITVTNDLDEYAIAVLSASPVDSYGVGTSVVTGSGVPAAGMVYKLVAHKNDAGEWIPVAKTSDGKASVGGRKVPIRHLDASGTATAEVVHVLTKRPPRVEGRELLATLMTDGAADPAFLGAAGVAAARTHNAKAIEELPEEAFRLGQGEPVLNTQFV
jgi:nicotinate phosphoribosyltransferase